MIHYATSRGGHALLVAPLLLGSPLPGSELQQADLHPPLLSFVERTPPLAGSPRGLVVERLDAFVGVGAANFQPAWGVGSISRLPAS